MQRQVTWPVRPVACRIARSVAALTLSWNDSNWSQVIAVSKRVVDDAALNGTLARMGHADEGVAPGAGRAFAVGVGGIGALGLAAVIGAPFERPRHPRFDWVIARFEGQHQDRHTAICSARVERLLRIEDTAIRRK